MDRIRAGHGPPGAPLPPPPPPLLQRHQASPTRCRGEEQYDLEALSSRDAAAPWKRRAWFPSVMQFHALTGAGQSQLHSGPYSSSAPAWYKMP